jgi:hypothetical protein
VLQHIEKTATSNKIQYIHEISHVKGLSSKIGLAESGIILQNSLKGEELRFATGFGHSLSCERPFKWLHHLIQDLEGDIIPFHTYLW